MPRRPASVTQADVARIIRAAKAEGWHSVRVRVGSAVIEVAEQAPDHSPETPVEPKPVQVL